MQNTQQAGNQQKIIGGLKAVQAVVREAVEIMHYGNGEPVTALDGVEIERAYCILRSSLHEIKRAISDDRELLRAAKKVIANWNKGDLAAAVRSLDAAISRRK